MGRLAGDALSFAVGATGAFHFTVWLIVTASLLALVVTAATIGRTLTDPIAVEVALRPRRVGLWMALTPLVLAATFAGLAITVVGAPIAVVAAFALLPGTVLAYLAVALVFGDRLARALGWRLTPWAAGLLGVLVFRVLRLIPFVGATLHSIVVLFAMAALLAVLWDVARSWHRRRLDDDEQFDNTGLIEWDPEKGPQPPRPPQPRPQPPYRR